MSRQQFEHQARVMGREGGDIGTLVDVDDASGVPALSVLLRNTTRMTVRISLDDVDYGRSSPAEIVLLADSQDVLDQSAGAGDGDILRISLAEEQLRVRTREVETGRVVVRKRVETVPTEIPVDLAIEEVDIERVAIGRLVDEAPETRQEGDTLIVPVVEEVLVVETRLRLVEEVRITRRQVVEGTVVREDLRREVVDVVEDGLEG